MATVDGVINMQVFGEAECPCQTMLAERMIFSETFQAAVAQSIKARVTDVGHVDALEFKDHGDQCRAHAEVITTTRRQRTHGLMGAQHSAWQLLSLSGSGIGERCKEHIDRYATGDIAGRVPPESIRDGGRRQRGIPAQAVLVTRAMSSIGKSCEMHK
jgi:hypothetical protein